MGQIERMFSLPLFFKERINSARIKGKWQWIHGVVNRPPKKKPNDGLPALSVA